MSFFVRGGLPENAETSRVIPKWQCMMPRKSAINVPMDDDRLAEGRRIVRADSYRFANRFNLRASAAAVLRTGTVSMRPGVTSELDAR